MRHLDRQLAWRRFVEKTATQDFGQDARAPHTPPLASGDDHQVRSAGFEDVRSPAMGNRMLSSDIEVWIHPRGLICREAG